MKNLLNWCPGLLIAVLTATMATANPMEPVWWDPAHSFDGSTSPLVQGWTGIGTGTSDGDVFTKTDATIWNRFQMDTSTLSTTARTVEVRLRYNGPYDGHLYTQYAGRGQWDGVINTWTLTYGGGPWTPLAFAPAWNIIRFVYKSPGADVYILRGGELSDYPETGNWDALSVMPDKVNWAGAGSSLNYWEFGGNVSIDYIHIGSGAFAPQVIPEPTASAMLGLVGLIVLHRRPLGLRSSSRPIGHRTCV